MYVSILLNTEIARDVTVHWLTDGVTVNDKTPLTDLLSFFRDRSIRNGPLVSHILRSLLSLYSRTWLTGFRTVF